MGNSEEILRFWSFEVLTGWGGVEPPARRTVLVVFIVFVIVVVDFAR